MKARALIAPEQATNEGVRQLRELRQRMSAAAIARKIGCDEAAVRSWTHEKTRPSLTMRTALKDVFGIAGEAWERPPDGTAPRAKVIGVLRATNADEIARARASLAASNVAAMYPTAALLTAGRDAALHLGAKEQNVMLAALEALVLAFDAALDGDPAAVETLARMHDVGSNTQSPWLRAERFCAKYIRGEPIDLLPHWANAREQELVHVLSRHVDPVFRKLHSWDVAADADGARDGRELAIRLIVRARPAFALAPASKGETREQAERRIRRAMSQAASKATKKKAPGDR